jgi:hypothetical protein
LIPILKRVPTNPLPQFLLSGFLSGKIMANPWFRLYSEFAHDPKIQMLSEAMQRRYVMLLCLRCSEVLETLHETEIAFQLRLSTAELDETKQLFIAKNFIDKQWNLLNWDKRQFVSDSSTMRVARHREKKKQESNVDETLQKRPSNATDTDTDTDTEKKKNKRGSRLASDFCFTKEWEDFCQQTRPELNPVKTFDQFKDYWIAQAGQKGVKLDWFATWRNWVRSTNVPKQNPYDIVRLTVPSKNEPDAALEKIKADDKKAVPIPLDVLAKMAELRKKA